VVEGAHGAVFFCGFQIRQEPPGGAHRQAAGDEGARRDAGRGQVRVVFTRGQRADGAHHAGGQPAGQRGDHGGGCGWLAGGYRAALCSDDKVANRNVRDFGWEMSSRGRFVTPVDFPLHDCSPDQGLHIRRESLGFVHRSRAIFCRPVPNNSQLLHCCMELRCGS
jgi:hypothetical protein